MLKNCSEGAEYRELVDIVESLWAGEELVGSCKLYLFLPY